MDEWPEKLWYMCECMCVYVCVWLKRRNAYHLWKHGQNLKWGKSDRETNQPCRKREQTYGYQKWRGEGGGSRKGWSRGRNLKL